MKKILICSIILFSISISKSKVFSQGIWTQKTNYPDQVSGTVGFSIGDFGYIGLGFNPGASNAFWKYNPTTNNWTQVANFPGNIIGHAVGFNSNNKGYIGTGLGNEPTFNNEFWQYNPVTDLWSQKANFLGVSRSEATGFSLNGNCYLGLGWNQTDSYLSDFWTYDTETDIWTQIANLPGGPRIGAVGFSVNGKGYTGLGYDSSGYKNDIWEYNPTTDIWIQKADFPSTPRGRVTVFVIDDTCYLGTGNSDLGILYDFWKYNSETDTWAQLEDNPALERQLGSGFTINNKGYIGTGAEFGIPYYSDFWEFDPNSLGIDEIKANSSVIVYPNPLTSESIIQISISLNNAKLIISNSLGQTIKEIDNVYGQQIPLNLKSLNSGIYLIQIIQEQQVLSTNKIIID